MNPTAVLTFLFLVLSGASAAQILPTMDGYNVEVRFHQALEDRMTLINSQEQRLESRFRENRHYAGSHRSAGTQRFAKTRTINTEWAGERLLGGVADFTLENLIKAMVAYNMNRAVPEFRGKIEVDLVRLKLSNPPTAFLNSFQSYANGRFKVTSSSGDVIFDDDIRANLVIDLTVNRSYTGPDLAFVETDPSKRVGPTLAYFVKLGLERAWPARKGDIVGPTIIRVSEPGERVLLK